MSRKSLSQEEEAQIIADAIANRDDETVNLTISTVRIVPNVSAVLSVEVSMEELGLLRMCQKIIDAFPESNTGSDPEAVIIRQSLSLPSRRSQRGAE